jgi:outer membrane protein assembly factor BamD (BamD/ComL family)
LVKAKDKRLEAERKLIEMARTSLARGQSEAALGALRRHLRLYPRGELAEERDSLWVSVLVARSEHAQAREQAVRFHHRYPHSLFGPMVDQAVKSIP